MNLINYKKDLFNNPENNIMIKWAMDECLSLNNISFPPYKQSSIYIIMRESIFMARIYHAYNPSPFRRRRPRVPPSTL